MTPAAGGLFGAAPKTGGLFGAPTATPAAGGFGFGAATPTATTMGGGLFGMTQQTPASTLGGAGGLFGASMATPLGGVSNATPGGTLTAAIDKNPYGVNPLFTPSGKTAIASVSIEPTIIPPRPADTKKPIMTPHFKVTPRSAAKIKLRGFAGGSPAVASTSFSDTKNNLLLSSHTPGSMAPAQSARQPSTPAGLDARFTPRKTMTKLILTETPDTQVQSFISEAKSRTQQQGAKEVTFDPSLEESALSVLREARAIDVDQENVANRSQVRKSDLNLGTPGSLSSSAMTSAVNTPFTPASSSDYQIEPTLSELLLLSDEELHAVEGFCVSLPQVGSIKFLKPVDLLTASPTGTRAGISQIPGSLIILEPKVCTVYPDEDCKPPVGFGLNVTAEINLEKCWPVDKATRRPITDESDPRHDRHMRKLESMSETRWLGFHNPSGTWRFQVDHFSRYGLLDDEGSDGEAVVPTPDSLKAKTALVIGDELPAQDQEELDDSTIKDSFAHVKVVRLANTPADTMEAEYEDEEEGEYGEEEWSDEDKYDVDGILEQAEITEADQDATILSDSESTEKLDQILYSTDGCRFTSLIEEKTMSRHVQGMKASYFKQPDSSAVPTKTGAALYFGDKPLLFSVPVSLKDHLEPSEPRSPGKRPERDSSPESLRVFPESRKGFVSTQADELEELDRANRTAPSPRKYLKSFLDQRALEQIPFKDSASYQKERLLVDSGLLMGRSFRVAWGPDGSFYAVKRYRLPFFVP
jgi:hypothetical protein